MDRVAIKQKAMDSGKCGAEYVDQLCQKCWESNRECPYVPKREDYVSSPSWFAAIWRRKDKP